MPTKDFLSPTVMLFAPLRMYPPIPFYLSRTNLHLTSGLTISV